MHAHREIPGQKHDIPRVSVVIAAYNVAPYLGEAIESILSQTYTDFELIVVDDGSDDEPWQVLDRFSDPRIVYLRNERNLGQARTRNRGNALARGEYIAVQDADDLSTPDRLEKQVSFLDQHPNIGIVGSQCTLIGSGSSVAMHVPTDNDSIQSLLLGANCMLHSSLMIRKRLLDYVNGYNETYLFALDYDLVLRIAELAELANLPDILYIKRGRPGSITYSAQGVVQRRFGLQALDEALARRRNLGQSPQLHPDYVQTCLATACAEAAFGDPANLRICLEKALEVDPGLVHDRKAAQTLANYSLGYALEAEAAGGDPHRILHHIMANWPVDIKWPLVRRADALVCAGLGFSYYHRGGWGKAASSACRALLSWPSIPGARGLFSVISRSLLRLTCPRLRR